MKKIFAFFILFILPFSLHAIEGETKIYHAGPFAFEAPVGYWKVEEIGPSAYNIYLVENNPKLKNTWITVVFMSKEQQIPQGLSYFKTTYLGTAKPAEKQVAREILKKKVNGDWQQGKIPAPLTLEAYEVTLSDGSTAFLGFRRTQNISAEKAEKFFNLFAHAG